MAKALRDGESVVIAGKKSLPREARQSPKSRAVEVRELFAARIRSPRPAKITHCLNCGVKLPRYKQKFCTTKCAKHAEYLKRKAHYLAKSIRWRKANIDRVRAAARARSKAESQKARKRGWRAKNHTRTKQYRAKWWEKYGEQIKANQREKWSKMDPKHKRTLQRKYERNAQRRKMEQELMLLLHSLSKPQEE